MTPRRSIIALVACCAILLTGCVETPAEPPRASEIPSPEPQGPEPYPSLDITCDELVPASEREALWLTEMPEGVVEEYALFASGRIPSYYSLRQLGATTCYWATGESSQHGGVDFNVDLTVLVRPHAADEFEPFGEYFYFPEDAVSTANITGGFLSCFDPQLSQCVFDGLVSDHWLVVSMDGPDLSLLETGELPGVALEFIDAIAQRVAAAPERDPWSPPAGTLALPGADECEAYLDVDTLTTVLAPGSPLSVSWNDAPSTDAVGGLSQLVRCFWRVERDAASVGSLTALEAGAWGWPIAHELGKRGPDLEPFGLDGLADGEEAFWGCEIDGDGAECEIDLLVGGGWIQLTLSYSTFDGRQPPFATDPAEAIVELGERVLTAVRG